MISCFVKLKALEFGSLVLLGSTAFLGSVRS